MSWARLMLMAFVALATALSPGLIENLRTSSASAATITAPTAGVQHLISASGNGNHDHGNGNHDHGNGNDDNGNGGNDNEDDDNDNGGNGNGGNGNGGNGNDDNGNGGNGNGGNGNGGNGNGGNGNGGNGNGGNGNGGGAILPFPPSAGGTGCISAGRGGVFTSTDGRVVVTVFPTLAQNIRITIQVPVDPASVPAVPGQKVGNLILRLSADDCRGGAIAVLPAEVNLSVRYSDQDAAGLTEASFAMQMLSPVDNQWKAVDKQANDPINNLVGATITQMGAYAVNQRP